VKSLAVGVDVTDLVTFISKDGVEQDAFVVQVYPPEGGKDRSPEVDVLYLSPNPDAICRGRRQHLFADVVPYIEDSITKRRCWKKWRAIIPGGGDGDKMNTTPGGV